MTEIPNEAGNTKSKRELLRQVARHPHFHAALQAHGFSEARSSDKYPNPVLKFTKPGWTIPCPGPKTEGVNIHFEMRGAGDLRLDVEVFPYERDLGRKPARQQELAPQLALKTKVHREVRERIARNGDLAVSIGANDRGLRNPEGTSTLGAAKFDLKLGPNITVENYAARVCAVLDAVTAMVDEIAGGFRSRQASPGK